jgi:hypothetical protein
MRYAIREELGAYAKARTRDLNHDKMMHYTIQVSDNNKTSVEVRFDIAPGAH